MKQESHFLCYFTFLRLFFKKSSPYFTLFHVISLDFTQYDLIAYPQEVFKS